MTLPHTDNHDASQLLDQEISALETVMQALDAEYAALEARDAEALVAASQLKLKCIETASLVSAERARLLPAAGDTTATAGTGARWQQLATLASDCKKKNERNGMLIRLQQKYVEEALAVVRNSDPDQKLYGAKGESHRGSRRQSTLGTA